MKISSRLSRAALQVIVAIALYQGVRALAQAAPGWRQLVNSYGWKLKYPPGWQASGHGEDEAETDGGPVLQGPPRCNASGLRCVTIQIDAMPEQGASMAALSPRDYLVGETRATWKLLHQRAVVIGGAPAYQIDILVTNMFGWPQGMPMRVIATKLHGKMLVISYSEEARDTSAIRSPADWTELATFEKLLSTFTFTRR